MKPETSGWRSSTAYDFVDDTPAPNLAWEWLRRNTDYQLDYARTEQSSDDGALEAGLIRHRWGLHFRC